MYIKEGFILRIRFVGTGLGGVQKAKKKKWQMGREREIAARTEQVRKNVKV